MRRRSPYGTDICTAGMAEPVSLGPAGLSPVVPVAAGRLAGTCCCFEPVHCACGPAAGMSQSTKSRISAMDSNKPAQNIQDSFLNTARKERASITIYLLSGVKLTGRIRSFDKYSVVLEANGQEQLIFKHDISTVVMGRTMAHGTHLAHSDGKGVPATGAASSPASPAASAASASGTEG